MNTKKYTGGKPPFGYKWNDGKLIVDNDKRKYVTKIFRRAALGVSYAKLAELLNNANIKTVEGNEFTRQTIQKILQNKFYIGILQTKDGEIKGHEAIISEKLYNLVNEKKVLPL
jgi:hypothetical protein